MLVALVAATLISHSATRQSAHGQVAPCQAVPSLCMINAEGGALPRIDKGPVASDKKMSAYRFEARPCRIIGNMGCQKQARLQLFRFGEPLRETLSRTFLPR